MAKKYNILSGVIGAAFLSGLVVSVGMAQEPQNKKEPPKVEPAKTESKTLTELQLAKGELLKLQLQLAQKNKQLSECTIQVLSGAAPSLETEFLKQVGAETGAQWDWATMSAKKP